MFSSCLVRRRTVAPAGQPPNKPILTATKDELLARLHSVADPIQSFSMKAEMAPSVGKIYGGQVTDYPTISGFFFFRQPDEIRVLGLDPVVHSTILDMVSSGNDFKLHLPTKNEVIEGANDLPPNSENKLENLRPFAFLNSLLLRPPAPDDVTVIEDDSNEAKAVYIVMFIKRNGDNLRISRNVYFDRFTLQINRQKTFDAAGNITGETKYSAWKDYNGVQFPSDIDIARPQDGYELHLTVTDLKLNTPDVTPEKFVMTIPPGAKIRALK